MPVGAKVCAAVLATTFVVAAVTKAARRDETARAFDALGLRRPDQLVVVVAAVELITAVELVATPIVGASMAIFLLVAFSAVLVSVMRRGVPVRCACFGALSARAQAPVSWRELVRNGVLFALALVVLTAA